MRTRPLPPVDDLLAELAEQGVSDAPRDAPDAEAHAAFLALALHVAEHRKRLSFEGFSWEDPFFVAQDDKVTMRVPFVRLDAREPEAFAETLVRALPRVGSGPGILAVDARPSGLSEFQLNHVLYGEVTLFSWPSKPPEPADPRIDAAREAGWAKTLKEHNLLPGRGIVVLDEHQGLLLRDERLGELRGLLVLLPSGLVELLWNPFARDAQSEMQYWLGWGSGQPSSAWRELLRYDGEQG